MWGFGGEGRVGLFPFPGQRINSESLEGFITMQGSEMDKKGWEKLSFTVLMTA